MKKVLLLLMPVLCAAQSGYVVNAVSQDSSQANVIVPAMLAQIQMPLFVFVSAGSGLMSSATQTNILIRPAGSSTLLPVNIVSSISPLTFVVPAGVPYGSAEVLWQTGGSAWSWTNVVVAKNQFGLASTAPQIVNANGSLTAVGAASPAIPGQVLQFTGSGLGYGTSVSATVAGLPATVIYAGRGSAPGYDQIQLKIPDGSISGCFVPVTLNAGDSIVNTSISITPDGMPCQSPFALAAADLRSIDSGGAVMIAQLSLGTVLQVAAASNVHREEAANLFITQAKTADLQRIFSWSVPTSGCTARNPLTAAFIEGTANVFGTTATLKNSTGTLMFTGSDGAYQTNLPPPTEATLASLPPTSIPGGAWTFMSSGSTDLAPVSFGFTLPAPVFFSGATPFAVRRDTDQTFTWNGSAFDSSAAAILTLTGTSTVICTAPGNAGSITIPASVLSSFPANSVGNLTIEIALPALVPAGTAFKTKGGAVILPVVRYSSSDRRPVDFQ